MSASPPSPAPPAPSKEAKASATGWVLVAVGLLLLSVLGLWAWHRKELARADTSLEARALAAQPPSPAAAAAYREGMALMQQYRWAEAVPAFQRAAALDPAFALPALRLTVALYFLGDSTTVIHEMQEAVRLSTGAPAAVRLRVEPHYYWSENQWEKCAASARALRESEPDNFEALFPSLLLNGCVPAPESLALMSRLRASGSPATLDARFDLMEARLAFAEHEDRRSGEALDRAEAKVSGPDNRFLRAAALRQRSKLAARAGRFDVALQLLALAETTYVQGGHTFEAARVAGERAEVLEAKGEFLAAAGEFDRQLTLLETFGATYAGVLAAMAGAADDLAAADPARAAALLNRVKGYPQRILQNVDEVYASFGRVALEQGNLAGAAALVEPALKNLAKDASAAEPVLLAAAVEREQDRLGAALERLQAATAVVAEDQVQVRIAELLLDQRDGAGASKIIEQLSSDPLARAYAARLRARSFRLAGQASEAKSAAAEAVEAARPTRQLAVLQAAQLELARAEFATGSAALAVDLLAGLEAQAQEHGAGRLLLEIRLAKLQTLPRGSVARNRDAKTLAADSRGAGFLRIARLAQEPEAR